MSAESAQICILYHGNGEPCMESLRQMLLEYDKRPVSLLYARSPEEYGALLGARIVDIIVFEDKPGIFPARRALQMAISAGGAPPFLCLTDAPVADAAALIREGAADCLSRGDPQRLMLAIIRETERSKHDISRMLTDLECRTNSMILDALSEGVVLFNRDGEILRANKDFSLRFGMQPEQLTSVRWADLIPREKYGDLIVKRMEALQKTFDLGIPEKFVDERDGRVFHSRFYPVFERERVSAVALITADITDRFRLEQQAVRNTVLENEAALLRKKERQLLEILDAAADGSCIIDFKAGTLNFSEKWLRRIGAENVPNTELGAYFDELIHPADRYRFLHARQEALRCHLERMEFEFRLRTPDGKYLWTIARGKQIYDENGAPSNYYGTLCDISEQKITLEALRKTKHELTEEVEALRRLHQISSEYLATSSLTAVYGGILDAAIDVTHADKGHIQLGVPQENSLKIITERGFHKPFLTRYAAVPFDAKPYGVAFKGGSRVIIHRAEDLQVFTESEISYYRGEGIVSLQSTPIISSSGTIYGVLSTHFSAVHYFSESELRILDLLATRAADFIERKRSVVALEISERNANALVAALQRADRGKNEFLSQLSHELRNPLATINTAVSLIQISDDLVKIHETNEILKSEVKQLSRLVDDLLDVTRITTNKIKPKKKLMNLTETVVVSAHNFRVRFAEKNVHFSLDAAPSPVILLADPARLMQIIENLLTNALKYTDEGGTVTMSLRVRDGEAVIVVKDNGIGVSAEELPMLFNAFYQGERSLGRPDSGLGLGLAIVKAIAELHGGHAAVQSQGPGTGATFTVTLPLCGDALSLVDDAPDQ